MIEKHVSEANNNKSEQSERNQHKQQHTASEASYQKIKLHLKKIFEKIDMRIPY
jgi:hypothetical protein